MCIMTLMPKGVETPVEGLRNGGLANRDGYGYAIATGDGFKVGHGFGLEAILAEFAEAREAHGLAPAIFHSRFSTHGSDRVENLHPFVVPASGGDVYLAHNGIMPSRYWPAAGVDKSDTRIYTGAIRPSDLSSRGLPSRRSAARMAADIGTGNKLILLHKSGRARIINAEIGEWSGGCWWSNGAFKRKPLASFIPSVDGRGFGARTSSYSAGGWSDPFGSWEPMRERLALPAGRSCGTVQFSDLPADDDGFDDFSTDVSVVEDALDSGPASLIAEVQQIARDAGWAQPGDSIHTPVTWAMGYAPIKAASDWSVLSIAARWAEVLDYLGVARPEEMGFAGSDDASEDFATVNAAILGGAA